MKTDYDFLRSCGRRVRPPHPFSKGKKSLLSNAGFSTGKEMRKARKKALKARMAK